MNSKQIGKWLLYGAAAYWAAALTIAAIGGGEAFGVMAAAGLDWRAVYLLAAAAGFAALWLLFARWRRMTLRGINNPLAMALTMITRYNFLMRQLVSRDFKKKYKRSVLGVAWSFLNPLLTMGVQYIVFSTLFRRDTRNYPVYLLTGTVFFNFFNEACTHGMDSITSNAALIKKVYIPKYIFPFSRVISSLINFLLTLIPLTLVMLLTGTPIRPSAVLLVFDIACMTAFVTGMVLLLTTAMTFFQDTRFLWGVASMLLMYLTPIFYPVSIIPQSFLPLYSLNPMVQYITFARTLLIDGVSPGPGLYAMCMASGALFLTAGVIAFRRMQDRFMLSL